MVCHDLLARAMGPITWRGTRAAHRWDLIAIPQRNRNEQKAAIRSLAYYAQLCSRFVSQRSRLEMAICCSVAFTLSS